MKNIAKKSLIKQETIDSMAALTNQLENPTEEFYYYYVTVLRNLYKLDQQYHIDPNPSDLWT